MPCGDDSRWTKGASSRPSPWRRTRRSHERLESSKANAASLKRAPDANTRARHDPPSAPSSVGSAARASGGPSKSYRQGSPMTRTQQVIKRAADVIVSASVLVVLLPLLPLVALLIKLDSAGPVFYVARRYGQNRRPFDFYKLRTMISDADRRGSVILTQAGD